MLDEHDKLNAINSNDASRLVSSILTSPTICGLAMAVMGTILTVVSQRKKSIEHKSKIDEDISMFIGLTVTTGSSLNFTPGSHFVSTRFSKKEHQIIISVLKIILFLKTV